MKLFFAVDNGDFHNTPEIMGSKYILTSYYYTRLPRSLIDHFEDHLLDSGAFTFIQRKHKSTITKDEFVKYQDGYAEYIKQEKIKHFFELDIDMFYGYEFVLELRERLEKQVGRKCIPVWHFSRGREVFEQTSKEYEYVALGGIAANKNVFKYKHLFPLLNRIVKQNGGVMHGLGYTPTKGLEKSGFYSTDSTTWRTGRHYAKLFFFHGGRMVVKSAPEGKRLADYRGVDAHNVKEWIKYQEYLDRR